MPYPILTLPYPFAQRLCQLLSPFELSELQKAAGYDVANVLKPIVETRHIHTVNCNPIYNDNDNADSTYEMYDGLKPLPKKDYLIKCMHACFYDMSDSALDTFNVNRKIMFDAVRVNCKNCHVSYAFLKSLLKMLVKSPSQFDLRYCYQIDKDVTFLTILTLFPHVNHIALQNVYFGWLIDLSITGKKFHVVEVFGFNFEDMFSFEPEELYNFVTQQYSDFNFHIFLKTDDVEATFNKIALFIDPRFDTEINGGFKLVVTVALNYDAYFNRRVYYYKNVN
uniref:F-box domain-containing protein n=1 Tax=Panagrellus redivivus TaxID=6233 RepID=A0A7E4ULC8_PANRE